jgi:hypothetical protein
MEVEGVLFGKKKGTSRRGDKRDMEVNMIKVHYMHV